MRKYLLPLLSIYLDFITIDAVVGLATILAGDLVTRIAGGPVSWPITVAVSLAILIALRFANLSVGDRLLAYAFAERERGVTLRQWPNLVLGTVGYLSGLKELVRWSMPGDGIPFLFMVEETPLKIVALTAYGLLVGLGGVMLLRFAPGGKLLNAVVLAFSAILMAINLVFYHNEMVAALISRRTNMGRSADPAAMETMIAYAPLYGAALFAALFAVLYLCRERAARA